LSRPDLHNRLDFIACFQAGNHGRNQALASLIVVNLENMLLWAVAGFAVSLGAIVLILRACQSGRLAPRSAEFHHPDHSTRLPIPRFGGIALAAAFAVLSSVAGNSLLGFSPDPLRWVIAGMSLAMFGLGLWDDLRPLGAKRKLAGQLIIATAAYCLGLGIHHLKIPLTDQIIDLGFYSWPATVFWLVAMTNLINLIDGVDGLAGGIALMLMVLLAMVGGNTDFVTLIAIGMGGALLAFLCFNSPPARIYLGDGGAYFLGFLIGSLTIYNSHKGTVVAALIAPLFVLALPILDTSLAVLRRGLMGLPLFRPDRRHLHHRLLQSGVSRENLALGAYGFTGFFLLLGLLAFFWRGDGFGVLLGGGTLMVLLLASQFGFSQGWLNVGATLRRMLKSRADIKYALAQSHWLAMEGERGQSLESICEDTALIARRLGFARLRIQLGDGEKVWQMADCHDAEACARQPDEQDDGSWTMVGPDGCRCLGFRHVLPGHPSCSVELQTPNEREVARDELATATAAKLSNAGLDRFQVLGEVLAEGWAKSLADWHKQSQLPIRFK
jgi:UDP-GlcNAc:undecaprenyl-phosphate GlcNAc-1-phosphate transferase